jgi:uncharacterized protein
VETASPYDRLKAAIAALDRVVVAFSGGVDSSLVLAAAVDALGDRALAVTATSATYSGDELAQARAIAALLGARHEVVETREDADPDYRANPPERCYFCKRELFGVLAAIAARAGGAVVLDGTNDDDRSDFRPGHRAALEAGVRSPLLDLGIGKAALRAMARDRGLPNWDQPACACLASRIPYGVEITPDRLARIARAEDAIRALGFRVVRVRDHGTVARVEVGADEVGRLLDPAVREGVAAGCLAAGFPYAAADLLGYRTGSMNDVLPGRAP